MVMSEYPDTLFISGHGFTLTIYMNNFFPASQKKLKLLVTTNALDYDDTAANMEKMLYYLHERIENSPSMIRPSIIQKLQKNLDFIKGEYKKYAGSDFTAF